MTSRAVGVVDARSRLQVSIAFAKAHRAAIGLDVHLLLQEAHDRVLRLGGKLGGVGVLQAEDARAYSMTMICMPRQIPR